MGQEAPERTKIPTKSPSTSTVVAICPTPK